VEIGNPCTRIVVYLYFVHYSLSFAFWLPNVSWVSYLAYPDLLGTKGFVVVVETQCNRTGNEWNS
jgi:hypothetical protein